MNSFRKLDPASGSAGGFPLFERSSLPEDVAVDPALQVINRDLALWDGIARRMPRGRRSECDQREITDLARDLRALRDCYVASSHPRIRRALLDEAGSITRRMQALGKRLGVRGLAIRPLDPKDTLH